MDSFEQYLNKLREDVKAEPKTEAEKGFQVAVKIIYAMYNKYKKPNLGFCKEDFTKHLKRITNESKN